MYVLKNKMGLGGKLLGRYLGGLAGKYAGSKLGKYTGIGADQGMGIGQSLGGRIGGYLPFKKGGKIKKTGIVMVHKGETILPKGVKVTKKQRKSLMKKRGKKSKK